MRAERVNFCGTTKCDTRLRRSQKEGKLRLKKIKRRFVTLISPSVRFIFEWRGVPSSKRKTKGQIWHKTISALSLLFFAYQISRRPKPRFWTSAPLKCAVRIFRMSGTCGANEGGKSEFLRQDQARYEVTCSAKREKTAAQAIDLTAKWWRQRDAASQIKVYWNDNIDCECRGCLLASERGKGRPR